MAGIVVAVSRSSAHTFSKGVEESIRLVAGLGVEGDAHSGATVKHRSRVARDPTQPNLRQVHLIHAELHDELRISGFEVSAGEMGENVTDRFRPGLMAAVLGRDEQGGLVRKSGVMAIVLTGGMVGVGDPIRVELPPEPHRLLEPV